MNDRSNLRQFTPLTRDPLHERVYLELKRALMAGQLVPGTKLTVRSVAQALGVSNSPVRAALNRLFAEHAVDLLPNGSLVIPRISPGRFADLMNTRVLLEGRATELATPHVPDERLQELADVAVSLDASAVSGDIARFLDLNQRFKFGVYQWCASESLLALIESLWLQVGPVLNYYAPTLPRILDINYQRTVLEAIQARDAAAARAAMERDILAGRDFLLPALELTGAEPSPQPPSSVFAHE